jgi:hypothetical protein
MRSGAECSPPGGPESDKEKVDADSAKQDVGRIERVRSPGSSLASGDGSLCDGCGAIPTRGAAFS